LFVHHGQDTDAIFLADLIVIRAEGRGGMDDACTVFGCNEVAQEDAEGVTACLFRGIGFIGELLFVA
jgi:hypothetical protein